MAPRIEKFGLWTNKGGVGKTTLTFHLSSLYAHLHPDDCVLLVDMCPQANLSSTVLTYGTESGTEVVRQLQAGAPIHVRGLDLPAMEVPRTVAGYLHTSLDPANVDLVNPPKNSDFIVHVSAANPRCPPNMYLLCGDGRLDDMSNDLRLFMSRPPTLSDPYRITLSKLRTMFKGLQAEAGSPLQGKKIAVFIDTNPAFTEYTQLALCSMDKLVVPVNADDFSLQAVEYMFNRVWNLFEAQDPFTRGVRKEAFAVKAAERAADLLPKVAVVVHNRHAVRSTRATHAFQHLQDAATLRLHNAFEAANPGDSSGSVFVNKGHPALDQFQALYTGTMREMFGAGVGAAHTGIPMHMVLGHKAVIHAAFHGGRVIKKTTVLPLVTDLVKLLSLLLDDFDLSRLSAVGTTNLYEALDLTDGDRPALKRLLKWTARKRAYEECMAAAEARAAREVSDGEEDQEYVDPEPNANVNNGAAADAGAGAAAAAAGPAQPAIAALVPAAAPVMAPAAAAGLANVAPAAARAIVAVAGGNIVAAGAAIGAPAAAGQVAGAAAAAAAAGLASEVASNQVRRPAAAARPKTPGSGVKRSRPAGTQPRSKKSKASKQPSDPAIETE